MIKTSQVNEMAKFWVSSSSSYEFWHQNSNRAGFANATLIALFIILVYHLSKTRFHSFASRFISPSPSPSPSSSSSFSAITVASRSDPSQSRYLFFFPSLSILLFYNFLGAGFVFILLLWFRVACIFSFSIIELLFFYILLVCLVLNVFWFLLIAIPFLLVSYSHFTALVSFPVINYTTSVHFCRRSEIVSDADLKFLIETLEENFSENDKWENVIDKRNNLLYYNARCCKPKVWVSRALSLLKL